MSEEYSLRVVRNRPYVHKRPIDRTQEEADELYEYNKMMGRLPRWMVEAETEGEKSEDPTNPRR